MTRRQDVKAVFDTNLYVAAFLAPGGQAEQAVRLAWRGTVELHVSVPIITEVARVLREKFGVGDAAVGAVVRRMARMATIVRPRRRLEVVADDPDNRILECAVEAGADVIVSGDRHLLRLKSFEGVAIVRVADFLRMFPPDADEGAR